MLKTDQLAEILDRAKNRETPSEVLAEDIASLATEVVRLRQHVVDYSARVSSKLQGIEQDMGHLETENARLVAAREAATIERNACIGLISQMAKRLGMKSGRLRLNAQHQEFGVDFDPKEPNQVVVDLPGGQVSWTYPDSESHLFEMLPNYTGEIEPLSVTEKYERVMNPGFNDRLST